MREAPEIVAGFNATKGLAGLAKILDLSADCEQTPAVDKAFIEKNQIIERYLTGKLPFKGVQDFERYCRENPDVLEDIGLAGAVQKGVRLLEAGGKPEVWQEQKPAWWRQPIALFVALGLVVVMIIVAWLLFNRTRELQAQVVQAEQRLVSGPLRPPGATRTVRVTPDRQVDTGRAHVSVQSGRVELLELRVDVSFARTNAFRLTVEKQGQARVGTIHNLLRDSNGQLRVTVNTSGLHAGLYKVRIDGVTSRSQLIPTGSFNVRVAGG